MVGTDDDSGNSGAPLPLSGSRKLFWRSASWSASRSSLHHPDVVNRGGESNGNLGDSNVPNRNYPAPLTPRSQQHCKARSCLPPLQPLSIARRSLDEWPKAGSDDIGEWPQPPTPSGRANGERLKLDLSTIQRNPDKNSGLVKRDKIAFFDKECSKVANHIYLGGDAVARDRDILKQNGITHVLNCVGFVCPEYFKDDFMYRTLWLQDSPSEDITSILYDVFDYFEDVREQVGRVFVHCCQGVSRSTSLVIAYLMWREGQSFDDAFQYVKAARGIADPNMGFACQLLQCQKRVHAFPLSPSSLLRMYRIAPHSPYDPLHLVPKMLNDPSPSALDSRGAFIIHIPSAIYVWIGKNCEAIMERDARGAVIQIVRYERVQGPISVIKEGEEPTNFWDAFANLLPLMDKSRNKINLGELKAKHFPGERKIDSYNMDFEIFQKAITGGFVPPLPSSEIERETRLPVRESSWSVLRRKFASGNMKEFVSAPRISLSRVYSDSMMMVHLSSKSSSPSSFALSSSSCSPTYLSPDSLSSDSCSSSSSKYFSESSLDSPSAASPSVQVPSSLSSFSNMSLLSSNSSLHSMPNGPETRDAVTLESKSHSFSFQSKKFSPSLAERRGSTSKSLTLPTMPSKRVTNSASRFLASQEYGERRNKVTCSLNVPGNMRNESELMDRVEKEQAGSTQNFKNIENGLDDRVGSVASYQQETTYAGLGGGSWKTFPKLFEGGLISTALNEKQGGGLAQDFQPLVYRWPELEKIVTFDASYLNSKAALVIFYPSRYLGKKDDMILYIWIGSSFEHGLSQVRVNRDKNFNDVELEEIDWIKVGQYVLTEICLPEDTEIKIVKEGEETEEFLERLSLL